MGGVTVEHLSSVWHHSLPKSGLSRNFGGLLGKKDNPSRLPAGEQVGSSAVGFLVSILYSKSPQIWAWSSLHIQNNEAANATRPLEVDLSAAA